MRPTEAVVDLGAISRNVERLVAHAAPAAVCAITKADAYGHGAVAVSRVALDAGAAMVGVALVEEGVELRRSGVRAPILLLSEPRPNEMFEVVSARLTPTVYTPDGIAALVAAVGFEPGQQRSPRLGLLGMRERVELLNGEFHLHAEPGKGTRIDVRIPLQAAA